MAYVFLDTNIIRHEFVEKNISGSRLKDALKGINRVPVVGRNTLFELAGVAKEKFPDEYKKCRSFILDLDPEFTLTKEEYLLHELQKLQDNKPFSHLAYREMVEGLIASGERH